MGAVTYTDYGQTYLSSVLSVDQAVSGSGSILPVYDNVANENRAYSLFSSRNKQPNSVMMRAVQESNQRFVMPGSEGVKMMDLEFTSYEEFVVLKMINFELGAGDWRDIEAVYLADGQEIYRGVRVSENVIFKNINFSVEAGETKKLSVVVDVNDESEIGQRLRLDIANPEDLQILVSGNPYQVKRKFPIKGKYLTVVKRRPWGK